VIKLADRDEIDWIKKYEPWRLEKTFNSKEVEKVPKQVWNSMELTKINGVGNETAEDISQIYKSEYDLIEALKNDTVPLRNDIVRKLKKHYDI